MENSTKKYQCPCCDYYTLSEKAGNTFQLCPVCFWEDDGVQLNDTTYTGGANELSLQESRLNFKKYGYSDENFKNLVRVPSEEEL